MSKEPLVVNENVRLQVDIRTALIIGSVLISFAFQFFQLTATANKIDSHLIEAKQLNNDIEQAKQDIKIIQNKQDMICERYWALNCEKKNHE